MRTGNGILRLRFWCVGLAALALVIAMLAVLPGCNSDSTPVESVDEPGLRSETPVLEEEAGMVADGKFSRPVPEINPREKVHPFQGITVVDPMGTIWDVDPDDWCPSEEPDVYALQPAYPNPNDDGCTIRFTLPEAAHVNIMITKWVGDPIHVVRRLVDADYAAGTHQVTWYAQDDDGDPVGADIYRLLFSTPDFTCYGDIQVGATE